MAYALSTSFSGKRLQIDAEDGFFGGNLSYSRIIDDNKILLRFRIIHNSAHLVDGHYDTSTESWIDGRGPTPYTEDFGEITAAHQLSFNSALFKYYGGLSYSTLVRPFDLKRYNFLLGFEFVLNDIFGKIADKGTEIFLASHVNTYGTESYSLSQQTMLGLKLGDWENKGIVLYLSYYTGRNIFGTYYDKTSSRFGIGFSVDYP